MNRILAVAAMGMLACLQGTASAGEPLPGPVVDAAWLASHLDQVRVLDVGSTPESFVRAPVYATPAGEGARPLLEEAAGHLAGAVLVDPASLRVEREIDGRKVKAMLPTPEAFTALARSWGVQQGEPLVVVPLGATTADVDDATRLYWQFKVYGHDNIAILDGGLTGWLAEGRPWSVEAAVTPEAGNWQAGPLRVDLFAGMEAVEAALAASDVQLVDGRDMSQFYGLSRRSSVTAGGHLPGARALPPELVTRQVGGAARFLKAEEYRGVLQAQGIAPEAASITYCNTGHLASGAWFVMHEIVGNPKVALYDGSMHEWTTAGRPVQSPLN
ncbi:MAG: sulfurtransferase [Steroidobacteraceae bacterium]